MVDFETLGTVGGATLVPASGPDTAGADRTMRGAGSAIRGEADASAAPPGAPGGGTPRNPVDGENTVSGATASVGRSTGSLARGAGAGEAAVGVDGANGAGDVPPPGEATGGDAGSLGRDAG